MFCVPAIVVVMMVSMMPEGRVAAIGRGVDAQGNGSAAG
jgi:hypothetical protein